MFRFRLHSVLEFRKREEEAAKQKLLRAQASVVEAERALQRLSGTRTTMLLAKPATIQEHLSLQAQLGKLEDEERFAKTSIAVLKNEVSTAEYQWMMKKRDLASMEKLYDRDREEWNRLQAKREQELIDDLAVMRRRVAV